jgi:hypothetical protein
LEKRIVQLRPHPEVLSAYENKDRKAVESLLSNDFVFTSRTTIALTAKPISNAAGPIASSPPTYEIEKMLERDNEAFILYDCKTKNGGSSRNTEFFTIEGNKIKEVEVYFGSAPKEPA